MNRVVKVSIALPRDLLQTVRGAVEAGDYASTSEVVRDALRDWKLRRRPATLPVRRTDLTKPELFHLEVLCLRLDVLRLALRGSARKSQVDFAVDFAGADPAYPDDQRPELRSHLRMLVHRNVRLFILAEVDDPQAWVTVFPSP
jgi:Arc/MetJ-type ribon-helix-helix transcriptional regulator